MEMQKKWLREIRALLFILGGNALYALAVKLFILPADLMTGGTTGIALVVNYFTGCPISMFVLVFNVLMLLIGFFLLGKKFALTTIVSTFAYPIFLEFFEQLLGEIKIAEDPMLCTIFAGLGIGVALGVVIRNGASTGGMDIPPLVLNKYFKIPVSVSLYFFDICILAAQMLYNKPEHILYGMLLVMVYSLVLDKLLLIGTTRTEVKVVSKQPDRIREAILSDLDRGVTILHGEGGYLEQETQVILSVVSNRELPKVEQLIHSIDPESFMIVSRVSEVRGRGFSMSKKYEKKSDAI
ncbi:MAG: YitT family protein [Roseburia sp.]